MQAILAVALPFFALVVCGWLAARSGLLPLSALPGLNAFTLFFALPALLFKLGASGALLAGVHAASLLAYAAAGLAVLALVWALVRRGKVPAGRLDAAFAALTTAFPNSGFMGLPLLMGLLGPGAAGPIACTLLVDLFLISSLCLALSQQADAAHPLHQRLWLGLRPALGNPLPWAIAAGALVGALGLAPSGPWARLIQMLGDAASPVALFALGAMLERARLGWAEGPRALSGTASAPIGVLVSIKLVLHPALVWAATHALAGAGLPASAAVALTLTAALPCAGNVSLLAERYGADTGLVARTIVASTVVSILSFTLWAAALIAPGS